MIPVSLNTPSCRPTREHDFSVRFWRTKSGLECDFVLGREGSVAIVVKGGANPGSREFGGRRMFVDEHAPRRAIVVCNGSAPRRTADGIWILPWDRFLERLCGDGIVE